jgi:RNA polymerase sigma factor (sigma-70 family)
LAQLDPEARRFFDRIYEAARAGCLNALRGAGCNEEEATEIFAAAIERVMSTVDPIARRFAEPQMVVYLKNACWNRLVDGHRHGTVLQEVALSEPDLADGAGERVDELVARRELIGAIGDAILSLSPRDRLVFRLRHLRGLSPADIQARLGLTERTYRKVIQRANAQVRARVGAMRDDG